MQGQLDTDLSDLGRQQAHQAAAVLGSRNIVRIVASDLRRARETAEAVARDIGLEVDVDQRLRETHLGDWQECTHEEIDRAFPGLRASWRHDATWAPPGGGESRLDVAARAAAVIDELMRDVQDWDDAAVLVVAHGGTISALTAHLIGLPQELYPSLATLGNCGWAELEARPRFRFSGPVAGEGEGRVENSKQPSGASTARDPQWYLKGWGLSASTVAPERK